ncbi:ATP-binding protein [Leptolyngbya sp. BC1307]|uniref:sensor histidine kinase n=1 Tax=Leptolyngbya sp. BC1307 TaxID=2029589 RepID=UPI001F0B1D92|nr:ATP-binding protein [Leptolyngbya sp. BC1307]
MPALTVAVIISLILVAIGSLNISKISTGFQHGITTNFQLQKLNGTISHYDEVLTMSARMAAATGDLSWKDRYDTYEPLLTEAIEQAIELAPDTYALHARQINDANLKLVDMENDAFDFVNQNQPDRAIDILFSQDYQAQKEIYGNGIQQWSEGLSTKISTSLDSYGKGLAWSSLFSMVSFWILTAAWVTLLTLVNRYIHRRKVAETGLRQAKYQLEVNHQVLQQSEATLQQKAATLERTLKALQAAQVQIVQGEKMSSLGQLVAGVAHEINNPVNFIHANLNPISEYTNSLLTLVSAYQTQYPEPCSAIEAEIEAADVDFIKVDLPKIIGSMRVGTQRIRQIVLSLRNFSRSDEQGLKSVDIHEGLENTLLILQHRLAEKADQLAITLERKYGTLPTVECYPGQLNQVFMNLLANAIDAIEAAAQKHQNSYQGHITLRTSSFTQEDIDWVEIAIADTGIGIPNEIQTRIFDTFYTTKPVGKGTGMGLSISHAIITKNHHGTLSCKSIAGEGSEFIIQIPVIATTSTEPIPLQTYPTIVTADNQSDYSKTITERATQAI